MIRHQPTASTSTRGGWRESGCAAGGGADEPRGTATCTLLAALACDASRCFRSSLKYTSATQRKALGGVGGARYQLHTLSMSLSGSVLLSTMAPLAQSTPQTR